MNDVEFYSSRIDSAISFFKAVKSFIQSEISANKKGESSIQKHKEISYVKNSFDTRSTHCLTIDFNGEYVISKEVSEFKATLLSSTIDDAGNLSVIGGLTGGAGGVVYIAAKVVSVGILATPFSIVALGATIAGACGAIIGSSAGVVTTGVKTGLRIINTASLDLSKEIIDNVSVISCLIDGKTVYKITYIAVPGVDATIKISFTGKPKNIQKLSELQKLLEKKIIQLSEFTAVIKGSDQGQTPQLQSMLLELLDCNKLINILNSEYKAEIEYLNDYFEEKNIVVLINIPSDDELNHMVSLTRQSDTLRMYNQQLLGTQAEQAQVSTRIKRDIDNYTSIIDTTIDKVTRICSSNIDEHKLLQLEEYTYLVKSSYEKFSILIDFCDEFDGNKYKLIVVKSLLSLIENLITGWSNSISDKDIGLKLQLTHFAGIVNRMVQEISTLDLGDIHLDKTYIEKYLDTLDMLLSACQKYNTIDSSVMPFLVKIIGEIRAAVVKEFCNIKEIPKAVRASS